MASKDHHHDIDFDAALCKSIDLQLDHRIDELGRKIMELGRKKKEVEDVKKRLNEILMQFNDCKEKEDAEILKKRLDELIAEFLKIEESIGQEEGYCKDDDVKMGTYDTRCTQRKRNDVFDMGSDSTETEKESQEMKKQGDVKKRVLDNIAKYDSSDDTVLPGSTDNEDISTNIEGLEQDLKDTIRDLEKDKLVI